jgi:EAL domain-containing protein (putative c-di-GMP-specific phosphodiesterase class I)
MAKPRFHIEDIERGLHSGEFRFHYQPKVSFTTGRLTGAEALLRWKHPDGSILRPGDFLPQLEAAGSLVDVTPAMLPVLMEDLGVLRQWRSDIQVAFNISGLDLHSPYLVKMLRSFIGNRLIDPGNLQIEITETAVVDANERSHQALLDMVALGIEIVMDDYGTGYSSLDVLSRLPFSALKVDQGVVGRMAEDARNTHIVRSSLGMARELGIKTVAEGVETKGTYVYLMASGCDAAQGFWISDALPRDAFIQFLNEDRQWPASPLGVLYNGWHNHNSYRRKVLDTVYTLSHTEPDDWGGLPKTDLTHSPARCGLGRWYLPDGDHPLADGCDLEQLESSHRLMHAAGEVLVRAARDGNGLDDVREAMRNFMGYSDTIDIRVSCIVETWLRESLGK